MSVLGTLFIISAPSGAGKTSLVNALLKKLPDICVSVSHTTRLARAGEIEGVNYFFVNEAVFLNLEAQGNFLESAKVFNHFYGTSKTWVLDQLKAGRDVILEIDWQGAQRIKALLDCVSIFILPPSKTVLLSRLTARQLDSQETIDFRMAQTSQEISHYQEYDYLVINDDFESALTDLVTIVRSQRLKLSIQKERYRAVIESLVG